MAASTSGLWPGFPLRSTGADPFAWTLPLPAEAGGERAAAAPRPGPLAADDCGR